MLSIHKFRQKGYTLLELILVLVCIAALTSVLIYSIMGSLSRQQSMLRVATAVNTLVDSAHDLRSSGNYQAVSIAYLEQQGFLDNNWDKTADHANYNIAAYQDGDSCVNNNCFAITVNNLNNVCSYIKEFTNTKVIATSPKFSDCQDPKTQKDVHQIMLAYE